MVIDINNYIKFYIDNIIIIEYIYIYMNLNIKSILYILNMI